MFIRNLHGNVSRFHWVLSIMLNLFFVLIQQFTMHCDELNFINGYTILRKRHINAIATYYTISNVNRENDYEMRDTELRFLYSFE